MRKLFAAIVAATLLAPLSAIAQTAGDAGATPPPDQPKVDVTRNDYWEVACQEAEADGKKTKVCEMRQVLVQKDTNKEWLRIAVSFAPGAKTPGLRIFTPLGVLLQPGMVLQVDDNQPVNMQFAVCLARPPRCLVAGPMDDKMVDMLKRGIKGTISFVLPNKQKINAPFSLKGFTASLTTLSQR
jgi:invasion protein IalB